MPLNGGFEMLGDHAQMLAVDLGASGGRVMVGGLLDDRLTLAEAFRFAHEPGTVKGTLRWDWEAITGAVREGLVRAAAMCTQPPASLSCVSWALDFGLLDAAGRLLEPPASYRDGRTAGMPESFSALITPDELVKRVGAAALPMITLCQLRAMALREPEKLEQGRCLLHIADLVHYALTGVMKTDRSMATASGLRDLASGDWDCELLRALEIPTHFLPETLERPGVLGAVTAERSPAAELTGLPTISTAGHDTAAASLLCTDTECAFLSCGTWSMLGCLSAEPVVMAGMARDGLETVGATNGLWALICGLTGLWPLQQCMREWRSRGTADSWDALVAQVAAREGPAPSLIDVGAPALTVNCRMEEEIAEFCRRTGQPVAEDPVVLAQVILQSLALEHAIGIEHLRRATRRPLPALRMVGGGSANRLLCQLTADAAGVPVIAGPTEATAIGSLIMQAQVRGLIGHDVSELLERSFATERYEPREAPDHCLVRLYRDLRGQRV